VAVRIGIEKPPDHSLILRVVLPSLALEKLDATLAQGESDLDSLVPKGQVLRARKEVRNYL